MRLIDADELKNIIKKYGLYDADRDDVDNTISGFEYEIIMAIKNNDKAPMIDAVPVVRCKNCKHWKSENGKIGYCRNMKFGHFSKWIEIDICKKTKFDFFCAAGKGQI